MSTMYMSVVSMVFQKTMCFLIPGKQIKDTIFLQYILGSNQSSHFQIEQYSLFSVNLFYLLYLFCYLFFLCVYIVMSMINAVIYVHFYELPLFLSSWFQEIRIINLNILLSNQILKNIDDVYLKFLSKETHIKKIVIPCTSEQVFR